jgi:hypothetical protein
MAIVHYANIKIAALIRVNVRRAPLGTAPEQMELPPMGLGGIMFCSLRNTRNRF